MDIMAEEKSKTVKLADGKEYELPPINLNTLSNLEQSMGFGLGKLKSKIADETAATLRLLVWGLLKEKYPDMKLEDAGGLITFETLKDVSSILSKILVFS